MAKRKTNEYIFADAYICTSVKNLMSKQDMMRLASCKDLDSAEMILREYGYGEAKELHNGDIEWFIRREQNKHFDLIYDTIPERKELALYLFPYDYHNAKVCLKSEFLGITPSEDFLVSTSDTDWKKLVSMIRDRNYAEMSPNMKAAVIEATDLFGRGGDPQEIDIILDKYCYKAMLEAAIETDEEFLVGMVKLQIDVANVRTFIRLKEMKRPWSFFQKVFLPGGNIPEQLFISSYEDSYDIFGEKLQSYGLRDAVINGCRALKETDDFSLLEKSVEDVVMKFNKDAKYESFGIVPIAGYWYGKEVEIDNLRIILTGILIGSSPEQIGERLREPYV